MMVVTIIYVPLVLPLLLPGVEVNPWDIAKSLIVTMLIPIILGLVFRASSPEDAQHWAPLMNKISSVGLLVMLVTGLGLNISNIVSLIGSGGFLALILFVAGSFGIGFLLGGKNPGVRSVSGARHSPAQRGSCHPGHQPEFLGYNDPPLCTGCIHCPTADPDPDRALAGVP